MEASGSGEGLTELKDRDLSRQLPRSLAGRAIGRKVVTSSENSLASVVCIPFKTGEIANTLSREAAAGAVAQGGAEGGTLGGPHHGTSPERAAGTPPSPIFMAVLLNPRIHRNGLEGVSKLKTAAFRQVAYGVSLFDSIAH